MRKQRVLFSISQALLLLSIVFLLTACSLTRYVPEGEYLLSNVHLKVDENEGEKSDVNKGTLRNYVRQTPNSRLFSLAKTSLATYSLSGRDSTKWINRILRSFGEPPVIYDSLLAVRTCNDLRQELNNEGYLSATVRCEVKLHNKKADVTYHLHPDQPYYIGSLRYQIDDARIAEYLQQTADSTKRQLKVGMKFDLSQLDIERKRITSLLNDQGYYKFHKEYISYLADTIEGKNLIDITLHLAPYRKNAIWVLNDTTIKLIRKLKTGDGQYLWQPGLKEGQPDMLLNYRIVTSPYMPEVAAGNKVILFGDFKSYWIADRQGRSFQRLNELFAVTGQVGFRATQRVDGRLVLPEAMKCLAVKGA